MLELLIAAASLTAVDAERAFARDARRIGQWTAFRKYADDTAVMFTPQAIWAHEFLAGKKDPPKSIVWGPSHSWPDRDHPRPLGDCGRQVERLFHHRLGARAGRLAVDL